jgi:tetratricopeptide (TPR) repeat protein
MALLAELRRPTFRVEGGKDMKQARILMLAFGILAYSAHASQKPAAPDASLAAEAGAAYDAKDWVTAAALYEEISKQSAQAPPRVWLRLGDALRSLGKYQEALAAFDKATQAGAGLFGEYGKVAVYAAQKQPDKAFEFLEKAVQQGYNQPKIMSTDPNLETLRSDPRFAKLLEQAEKNAKPCAFTPENRQFDFWVGQWDVTTTEGSVPAGASRIELILEDCVVLENWQSLNNPYAGKSYNTYNQSLKRWEQYWVDNAGGNIFFYGGLKDGVMDYYTDEIPQPDNTKLKRHLQFIPLGPGKVRQFSQGSTDGGKTWAVEYDFTYARKKL